MNQGPVTFPNHEAAPEIRRFGSRKVRGELAALDNEHNLTRYGICDRDSVTNANQLPARILRMISAHRVETPNVTRVTGARAAGQRPLRVRPYSRAGLGDLGG